MSHHTTASTSPIEVDPKILANPDDESYESSGYNTSTESLGSSINEYMYENGRRYHSYYGSDKNIIPTDEIEQDRMDLQHEMFIMLLEGRHFDAPIGNNPQRILDIGTGTGIWAIDVADQYPSAEVIGVDLSPIQPKWVPPNCRFEVDDAELDFVYKPDSMDFIHSRNIGQSISDWPKLVAQMYKTCKPGGYVELQELSAMVKSDDNTLQPGNGVQVYFQHLAKAMVKLGRPEYIYENTLPDLLKEAGFVDIHLATYKQPLAPWPKDPRLKRLGAMNILSCETAYHAYGMAAFTRVLGLSQEEAEKLCQNGMNAGKNKNTHLYVPFHVAYGRKPE